MNYVAYYRVSTVKQEKSGLGLESQQSVVEDYVKKNGGEISEALTEVESGKNADRPKLDKALRRCELTGAKLVIAKLDRLSRDIEFIAKLQKSKTDFVCCDMPEANTLTIGMMAVLAQYEREMISERTKLGMAAAKRRGTKLGNPNLHLVRPTDPRAANLEWQRKARQRNDQVREVIAEFRAEAGETHLTLQTIADMLNAAGYTTMLGNQFRPSGLHRIIHWKPAIRDQKT